MLADYQGCIHCTGYWTQGLAHVRHNTVCTWTVSLTWEIFHVSVILGYSLKVGWNYYFVRICVTRLEWLDPQGYSGLQGPWCVCVGGGEGLMFRYLSLVSGTGDTVDTPVGMLKALWCQGSDSGTNVFRHTLQPFICLSSPWNEYFDYLHWMRCIILQHNFRMNPVILMQPCFSLLALCCLYKPRNLIMYLSSW